MPLIWLNHFVALYFRSLNYSVYKSKYVFETDTVVSYVFTSSGKRDPVL